MTASDPVIPVSLTPSRGGRAIFKKAAVDLKMERLRVTVADADLIKAILLCLVFIGLNVMDAWLTGLALELGGYELNFIIDIGFGSSMLRKGLVSFLTVILLVLVERGGLLKPLSIAMLLICTWNGLTVWFWS